MALIKGKSNTYRLRFSVNAVIDIEDDLGYGIHQIGDTVTLSMLRIIIMHALHYGEGKAFTKKETGEVMDDIIQQIGVTSMAIKVVEMLDKSLGEGHSSDEGKTEGK